MFKNKLMTIKKIIFKLFRHQEKNMKYINMQCVCANSFTLLYFSRIRVCIKTLTLCLVIHLVLNSIVRSVCV